MSCSSNDNYCRYYPIFKLLTHYDPLIIHHFLQCKWVQRKWLVLLHTGPNITTRFLLHVPIGVILHGYVVITALCLYYCSATVCSLFFFSFNRYQSIVVIIMMITVIPTVDLSIYWWSISNYLLLFYPLITCDYPLIKKYTVIDWC